MDGKIKVSFGIKTSKQGALPKTPSTLKKDVEYISSFDSSKPISFGGVSKGVELVIPSQANQIKGPLEQLSKPTELQEEKVTREEASTVPDLPVVTLDQLAAQELLKESKDAALERTAAVEVVQMQMDALAGATESTLEDYESVPVEDFGKAMLRGMGWQPGKGIGKNQRVVAPSAPQLRPKGLGLGADRVTPSASQPIGSACQRGTSEQAVETLAIGCGVQVTAGGHRGLYGKVVSHNEDTGRCIVKLEIGGSSVSVNENLVKAVGKEEYANNCRVLNAAKYKRYKQSSDERMRGMREALSAMEVEEQRSSSKRRHRSRSPHK